MRPEPCPPRSRPYGRLDRLEAALAPEKVVPSGGRTVGRTVASSCFVSVSSAFLASPDESLTWRRTSSSASTGLLTVPAEEAWPAPASDTVLLYGVP